MTEKRIVRLAGRGLIAAVVIAAAALALYAFLTRTKHVGLFHDDGVYAATAKSIAEGRGYRIINVPTAPYQTKYPILYPLLLSGVWRAMPLFPSNIDGLKAVNAITLFAFLCAAATLYRRLSSDESLMTIGLMLVVGLNPLVMAATDTLLSDLLFATFFTAALALHAREGGGVTPQRLVLCAGASGFALLTRQAGIALVVAGLIWAWQQGRRATALYAAVSFVFLVVAASSVGNNLPVANPVTRYYTGYEVESLRQLASSPGKALGVVVANGRYAVEAFGTVVFISTFPAIGISYLGLILTGALFNRRQGGIFVAALLFVYGAVILSYPFVPTRYLLPLVPLLTTWMFIGAQRLRGKQSQRHRASVAPLIPIGIVLLMNIAWARWSLSERHSAHVHFWLGSTTYTWDGFAETFEWVKSHTDPSDIVASAYDPMYFLYTGRTGVRPWIHRPETYFYPKHHPVPALGDPALIRTSLDEIGVGYLIIDPLDGFAERPASGPLFASLLSAYGSRATLVFTSRDEKHRVYRIASSSSPD